MVESTQTWTCWLMGEPTWRKATCCHRSTTWRLGRSVWHLSSRDATPPKDRIKVSCTAHVAWFLISHHVWSHCLYQVGGRHPPLLKVFLPVLLLHLQGEAWPQNSLGVRGEEKSRDCDGWDLTSTSVNKGDLQLAGQRRRLRAEQTQQLGAVPARYGGSCHHNQ